MALIGITIPTRDRPALLRRTIASILSQDFGDFTVSVVDNGTTELADDVVASLGDERIRYIRTGGLAMPANWDHALRVADGDFVALMNDKTEWRQGALGRISQIISTSQAPFLTWVIGPAARGAGPWDGNAMPQAIDNADVIRHAANCRIDLFQRFAPRGTNCAIRSTHLEDQFRKLGTLCRAVSPDYSLGTFLLRSCPQSLHLSEALAGVIPESPSNTHTMQNQPRAEVGYFSTLGISDEHLFRRVPLHCFLVNNILLNDILEALTALGETPPPIDRREYVLLLLGDLVILCREGRPWHEQARMLRGFCQKLPPGEMCSLAVHFLRRFREGWPNRKLRLRDNWPAIVSALRILLGR
jgi:hypothetical protein